MCIYLFDDSDIKCTHLEKLILWFVILKTNKFASLFFCSLLTTHFGAITLRECVQLEIRSFILLPFPFLLAPSSSITKLCVVDGCYAHGSSWRHGQRIKILNATFCPALGRGDFGGCNLASIQTIKFKFSEDNPSYSNTLLIHNVQDNHKYGTTCLISVAILFCHNFKKKMKGRASCM